MGEVVWTLNAGAVRKLEADAKNSYGQRRTNLK
jgi:hypothetical protein